MAYKWVCPATLLCAIFFVGLFSYCNTVKPRDGEKREAYIHPVSDEVYDTLLLLVQGKFEVPVSKRTRIQRNTVHCSILEKKRGLSPWTGKNAYVVFCRKKGCQEVFNINHRWKYFQTSKIWRLQKATISSGQQLCGFK